MQAYDQRIPTYRKQILKVVLTNNSSIILQKNTHTTDGYDKYTVYQKVVCNDLQSLVNRNK